MQTSTLIIYLFAFSIAIILIIIGIIKKDMENNKLDKTLVSSHDLRSII